MGYRFSLQTANIIANLSFGRVTTCYRDIMTSEQSFYEFRYFIDTFRENLFTSRMHTYSRAFAELSAVFENYEFRQQYFAQDYDDMAETQYDIPHNHALLRSLKQLSDIFANCKIKSILLPGRNGTLSREMISPSLLRRLVRMHPCDSCLILQPEEQPYAPAILNAFPNFDIALRQIDLWPAVLFWDNEGKYAFIPINNLQELVFLYEIIQNDSNPIAELMLYAIKKAKPQHYLLHLSDLHIGNAKTLNGLHRIKSMISKQIREVQQQNGEVNVLITGDAVDSPKSTSETTYKSFANYVDEHSGQSPIRILGNHDVNNFGLAFSHKAQNLVKSLTDFPRVQKLDDYNIILLLFNSNAGGDLAQGEIGVEQMTEMGNLLDKIPNIEKYKLVAVLHHHITTVPTPDFYAKKLFGRFLEKALILKDADLFMDWLKQRNVKVVLHGHKHIPFYTKINDLHVIACGSSTGFVTHTEKGKTYITYNLLKINDTSITCTQYAEDILGAGEKNIRTDVISL